MPQINQGIRSVLSVPSIYSLFSRLIGSSSYRQILARSYIRPLPNDRILDIGCGPGDMLPYLPAVEYVGFDASPEYITAAQQRFCTFSKTFFKKPPTFICEQVDTSTIRNFSYFDIVLALGILHHLDDQEAQELFQLARTVLRPGGRLITFDGVFIAEQSPCARWIISKDRGQNVRTKEGYLQIATKIFSNIAVNIRHDLLRIPYTHIILECTKGASVFGKEA